jgi:hypothetical protein
MISDFRFPGFTLPDGAWLPPEILEILPCIPTIAELKITIVAIYETMRLGGADAVISLSDFQALTGLSRKAVIRGINAAIDTGTIQRRPVGDTYIYTLNINTVAAGYQQTGVITPPGGSVKTPLPSSGGTPPIGGVAPPIGVKTPPIGGAAPPHVVMHACLTDLNNPDIHATGVTTTPPADDQERIELVREMRALGVALKVCQKMAIKFDTEYLAEKIRQARFAVEKGFAKSGPGWFVSSVREDWQPPLGYDPDAHLTDEERRQRYVTGPHAHLIQS